jgi:biopolymer transport protein ExbB
MIWSFMLAGGWCMAPIVGCSVLALALLLERAFYWFLLWTWKDGQLREELLALAVDRRRAERTRDPLCRVVYGLLRHPEDPAVALGIADRALRETRRGIPVINVIAGVSCSLGLFGTVLGVSFAFSALAQAKAEDLAAALAVALNTTVLGLIVYLPAYVGSSISTMLTNRLAFEIEQSLNTVQARLRSQSVGKLTITG